MSLFSFLCHVLVLPFFLLFSLPLSLSLSLFLSLTHTHTHTPPTHAHTHAHVLPPFLPFTHGHLKPSGSHSDHLSTGRHHPPYESPLLPGDISSTKAQVQAVLPRVQLSDLLGWQRKKDQFSQGTQIYHGFPTFPTIGPGTPPNTQSCSPWRVGSLTPGQPLPTTEKAVQPNLSISLRDPGVGIVWFGRARGRATEHQFP